MRYIQRPLTSLITAGVCALMLLGVAAQSYAASPAGTWTWTQQGRQGGQERKMTLKLKVEGDKLTGKIVSPGRNGQENETEIKDGKVKGDEISFTVTREFNGNSMTTKYSGKVEGDTIKGKTEMERNGKTNSRDWEAKRDKEAKK